MSVTVLSDERSRPIEKVRKRGIVALNEVRQISRWISDEVGLSKIRGELANINCTNATKRSMCLT